MNDYNVKQIENMWGFELGYNLTGPAQAGLKDWLTGVDDHEIEIVKSAIRTLANKFEESGKRPAPKLLAQIVKNHRDKLNIGPNDDLTEKVDCGLCGKTGMQWVVLAYSEQKKRRAPYPKSRAISGNKEAYSVFQPCFCSNGDSLNELPQFRYTPKARRKMAEVYGMPYNNAVDFQIHMIRLHDQDTHQPTYRG